LTAELSSGDRFPSVLAVSTNGGIGGPVVSLLSIVRASTRTTYLVAGPLMDTTRELFLAAPSVQDTISMPSVRRHTQFRLLLFIVRLARVVRARRRKIDVILANGLTEAAVCAVISLLFRLPLVVWVHNSELPLSARLMRPILRLGFLDVTWLCVSDTAARASAPVRGNRPFLHISNPLDEEQVVAEKKTAAQGVFRIGYLGAPREHKGFDLLPDIIEATMAMIDSPVEWLMFMKPGAMPEVHERLQSNPAVHFLGRVFPPKDAFAQVDLVVCPSRQESFGRVAAEAMMNGLVVVASRIPAYEELLAHSATYSLFDLADPAAAASLIATMVRDPALCAAVGGINAREAVKFSASAVAPEFEIALGEAAHAVGKK
jgi:glycosyltransferase involved in cell wall biosynthesis